MVNFEIVVSITAVNIGYSRDSVGGVRKVNNLDSFVVNEGRNEADRDLVVPSARINLSRGQVVVELHRILASKGAHNEAFHVLIVKRVRGGSSGRGQENPAVNHAVDQLF